MKGLHMQTITVAEDTIVIPDQYQILDPMPEDSKDMVTVGLRTQEAMCIVHIVPIPPSRAMPFDDSQAVVDGIHHVMEDDQGLVEVCAQSIRSGGRLIDSVVKSSDAETGGVQYTWTCDIEARNAILTFQGFFCEDGMTGVRDATIFELARRQDWITVDDTGVHGWAQDIYDPTYTRGNLPNLSEDQRFDSMFPQHPLSMLRVFRQVVVENN